MFISPKSKQLNWEAPCRVESRDDLLRAYLHSIEATSRVLVPLSVLATQHHPLVLAFAQPDVCARVDLELPSLPNVMRAFPPPHTQLGTHEDQVRIYLFILFSKLWTKPELSILQLPRTRPARISQTCRSRILS